MASGQTWSPDSYARSARFVSELGAEVVDWLAPRPGETILDLGCGDGALSARIAATGARVVGIDSSPEMVAAARRNGVDAHCLDAHDLAFDGDFDAVFTNAALHWMTRPTAVLECVRRALRPGGRFVGEFGGFGNVAAIRTALLAVGSRYGLEPKLADPWHFPTEESFARRLTATGFTVGRIVLFPRPTPLPDTGIRGWLSVFRAPFFEAFEMGPDREAVLDEVIAALAPLHAPDGRWVADYVRLRFAAVRNLAQPASISAP